MKMPLHKQDIERIWDTYTLPEAKRRHVTLVALLADFFAEKLEERGVRIDSALLHAAALLHDIDKAVTKRAGETHPDAGVRVLVGEGLYDVARLVATHPLHMILDPTSSAWGWEEKVLFLADKMVKHDIITVEERFRLWEAEIPDTRARDILSRSYPKVIALRDEIFSFLAITDKDIARFAGLLYT